MTESQKLDALLEAVAGLTQKVTGIDQKVTGLEQKFIGLDQKVTGLEQNVAGIRKDLSKTMLDVETLKDNQKAIIEGQQTSAAQLERKLDEAIEKINVRDNVQDQAIYKLIKVK